jgi:hypothetical protein
VVLRRQRPLRVSAIVLDPFAGSGTTAVACHELGRNYIDSHHFGGNRGSAPGTPPGAPPFCARAPARALRCTGTGLAAAVPSRGPHGGGTAGRQAMTGARCADARAIRTSRLSPGMRPSARRGTMDRLDHPGRVHGGDRIAAREASCPLASGSDDLSRPLPTLATLGHIVQPRGSGEGARHPRA